MAEEHEWKTAGEALVRRELQVERNRPGAHGVPHYVTGQHYARWLDLDDPEAQGAELSFVNVLGFVMLVPVWRVRKGDGWSDWEPAGVQRASGVMHMLAPRTTAQAFRLSKKMRRALREMEARGGEE